MLRPPSLRSWRPVGAVALLLGLFLVVPVRAQELPAEGIDRLEKSYGRDQRNLIGRLGRGEINPPRPEDEAVIDLFAKWLIYRFTWKAKYQDDPGGMNKLYNEFDGELSTFAKKDFKDINRVFVDKLGKKLILHAKEVLGSEADKLPPNDKPIARVNVARVLARLAAEPGQEEVADVFVELLKDKDQNPGVLYWAVVGLRDLLAQGQPRLDDRLGLIPPVPMKDKEREARCIRALIGFIERKLPVTDATPRGEVRAWQWLRREAVRGLGASRYPALVDDKKAITAPTALVLLRVLRKEGLTPPPDLDEQLEAAVGLARLESKLYDGYQPDYTAHEIGLFVSEFGSRNLNEGGEKGWKVMAARLTDALAGPIGFKADADKNIKDAETKKYIETMVTKCVGDVLKPVENKATPKAAEFGDWIGKAMPKSETVYRGVPEAKVKPPAEP
jgi:hypothetical protein